jgi:hypothetical protein
MVRDIGVVLFKGFSLLTSDVIPGVFQLDNEICIAGSRRDVMYDVRCYSAERGNVAALTRCLLPTEKARETRSVTSV